MDGADGGHRCLDGGLDGDGGLVDGGHRCLDGVDDGLGILLVHHQRPYGSLWGFLEQMMGQGSE